MIYSLAIQVKPRPWLKFVLIGLYLTGLKKTKAWGFAISKGVAFSPIIGGK